MHTIYSPHVLQRASDKDLPVSTQNVGIFFLVFNSSKKQPKFLQFSPVTCSWHVFSEFTIFCNFLKVASKCFCFKVHMFWEGHKILQISTVDLSYVVPVKSSVEISQSLWPSQNIWTLAWVQEPVSLWDITFYTQRIEAFFLALKFSLISN